MIKIIQVILFNDELNSLRKIIHLNILERRGTFLILTISIIVILLLVLIGIVIVYTVVQPIANYILVALIAAVILVGLISFSFLQIQKTRAENKRIAAANRRNRHHDAVDNSIKFEPSAPPLSNRTSWAYAPFRYSQRSTLLAAK